MKKLLLCVTALAVLAGCGGSDTTSEQINADLAKQKGACAEIAFADTKAKLADVDKLNAAGKTEEANKALIEAKDLYNEGVVRLNDLQGSADKATANLADQKSRLDAVSKDAEHARPKEYAASKARVDALHKDAADKIAACNVLGAEVAVNAAEKEVQKVEELAGKVRLTTEATYVVKKGDSLWAIAKTQYANPYFWPLIYWSNKTEIKDPDLIYPNQTLTIDNASDDNTKKQAEKFAKTRGAWSLYDNK